MRGKFASASENAQIARAAEFWKGSDNSPFNTTTDNRYKPATYNEPRSFPKSQANERTIKAFPRDLNQSSVAGCLGGPEYTNTSAANHGKNVMGRIKAEATANNVPSTSTPPPASSSASSSAQKKNGHRRAKSDMGSVSSALDDDNSSIVDRMYRYDKHETRKERNNKHHITETFVSNGSVADAFGATNREPKKSVEASGSDVVRPRSANILVKEIQSNNHVAAALWSPRSDLPDHQMFSPNKPRSFNTIENEYTKGGASDVASLLGGPAAIPRPKPSAEVSLGGSSRDNNKNNNSNKRAANSNNTLGKETARNSVSVDFVMHPDRELPSYLAPTKSSVQKHTKSQTLLNEYNHCTMSEAINGAASLDQRSNPNNPHNQRGQRKEDKIKDQEYSAAAALGAQPISPGSPGSRIRSMPNFRSGTKSSVQRSLALRVTSEALASDPLSPLPPPPLAVAAANSNSPSNFNRALPLPPPPSPPAAAGMSSSRPHTALQDYGVTHSVAESLGAESIEVISPTEAAAHPEMIAGIHGARRTTRQNGKNGDNNSNDNATASPSNPKRHTGRLFKDMFQNFSVAESLNAEKPVLEKRPGYLSATLSSAMRTTQLGQGAAGPEEISPSSVPRKYNRKQDLQHMSTDDSIATLITSVDLSGADAPLGGTTAKTLPRKRSKDPSAPSSVAQVLGRMFSSGSSASSATSSSRNFKKKNSLAGASANGSMLPPPPPPPPAPASAPVSSTSTPNNGVSVAKVRMSRRI